MAECSLYKCRVKRYIRRKGLDSYSRFKFLISIEELIDNPLRFRTFSDVNDIVICGMPRSGSTLLYNIVKQAMLNQFDTHDGYYQDSKDYAQKLKSRGISWDLKKTHDYSRLLSKRIEYKNTIGFFTHRNLLDVIASFKTRRWIVDMDKFISTKGVENLCYNAMFISEIPNIHNIGYRDLLENKIEIIKYIYKCLEFEERTEIIQLINERTSIKAMEEISRSTTKPGELSGSGIDVSTGIHKDHIDNPAIGKWRNVISEKQALEIVKRKAFITYCQHFNYDPRLV